AADLGKDALTGLSRRRRARAHRVVLRVVDARARQTQRVLAALQSDIVGVLRDRLQLKRQSVQARRGQLAIDLRRVLAGQQHEVERRARPERPQQELSLPLVLGGVERARYGGDERQLV